VVDAAALEALEAALDEAKPTDHGHQAALGVIFETS